MRVCVLLDTRALPTIGGGYTFERQIFQALLAQADSSAHEFVVFTLDRQIPQHLAQTTNIQFVALANEQRKLGVIWAGLQQVLSERWRRRVLKRHRSFLTRLRHAINQQILAAYGIDFVWSMTPLSIALDTPYSITVWDMEYRTQPFFPEMCWGDEWDQRDYLTNEIRRATYVFTGTQVGKQQVEKIYHNFPDRVRVIPFPTPQYALEGVLPMTQSRLDKYGLTLNQYLLYPAQFWPHKNHANLLYALKRLKDEHNLRFPLVLVGANKRNQGYIKQLTQELDLVDQVHFLGFVPEEDLVTLYQGAFALTFMSFGGPDNIPPLEAFALGCPVVASNVSGAQEQLGDAALIVDPADDRAIAEAIKSLHDDPDLRAQLIHKGYRRGTQWTSHDYVKAVLHTLDEFAPIRRCWP
jgi:glycosyltransferase involved in cell wall biosynthesis